jgi:1-acyl-sn-glycerol-3-phosphate acyltransferase
MSRRERIDEKSLLYRILKIFLVKPAHDMYYRKIQKNHPERIPEGAPVILAPNHQNALMDALAFVVGIKYQTVFLARADIFKSQLLIDLLTFIKILPIYRMRDGISSLQKNEEIFDLTVDILRRKINPLCMFPEGNHGDRRRLRPLVKGIFRIAFKAQEDYGAEKGVKIIPVGIDYSHYQKFRQTQFINFGEPIEVSEYWNEYAETPMIAMNSLRDRLSEEMKKVMIHIETVEYYDMYMGLRILFKQQICEKEKLKKGDLFAEFIADKKLIAALDNCLAKEPDKISNLNTLFKRYASLRDKLNFRDWVPVRKKYPVLINLLGILLSAFTWPLVILGLFNNWPHFFLPLKIIRGIKDRQFHSTAKWGSALAIIILYYLILIILALIFIPVWWLKILYIITLPSTGLFVLTYRKFILKSWARIWYTLSIRRKKPDTVQFKSDYDTLMSLTNEIYEKYKQ